jgi:uncharacterized protein DUF2834
MDQNRNSSMTRFEKTLCIVYAVIALVALAATWINNIAFFNQPQNGGALGFYSALYANPATASFTNDLLLYAISGCIFMAVEARRLGIRHVWIYILLSLLIAVSVMFPIFLIARQYEISRQNSQESLPVK